MKKDTARTLMIVLGVLILLAIVGLGSAVWLFTQSVDLDKADKASAARRLDQVRERFEGVTPVLIVRDGEAVVSRRPPAQAHGTKLSTLRIVHWDPDDDSYARVDLPFWLLRLKSGPIHIGSRGRRGGEQELGLTVEELERYGPTLVLDHQGADGEHVLIWTE